MLKILQSEIAFYYQIAIKNAPKPATMKRSQYINYLAIQLLEEIGNDYPSQAEIDLIESQVQCYLDNADNSELQSHELNAALVN